MKKGSSGARACAIMGLAFAAQLYACGKSDEKSDDEGRLGEDCSGQDCAASASPVDWSSKKPQYAAHLAVRDSAGLPLADAKILARSGGRNLQGQTDEEGRATLSPLDARLATTLRVSARGATPRVLETTAWKSSRRTENVELVPIGVDRTLDASDSAVIGHEGAVVKLPRAGIVNADGSQVLAGNKVKGQLTFLTQKNAKDSRPGSKRAFDKRGSPTILDDLQGIAYVHLATDAGAALNLAQGLSATLELPVPSGSKARSGDHLPLWTLDEETGVWREESSCTIGERAAKGGGKEQVCRGPVAHFSYWAFGTATELVDRAACLSVHTEIDASMGCATLDVESQVLLRCQGDECAPLESWGELFPSRKDSIEYCALLPAADYKVLTTYYVGSSACSAEGAPVPGRRMKLSSLAAVAAEDDAERLVDGFFGNPEGTCAESCTDLSVRLGKAELDGDTFVDGDNDGFFFGSAKPPAGVALDCDDADPAIFPGAPEAYCATEDRDCDGKKPAADTIGDVDATRWNTQCSVCAAADEPGPKPGAEVAGNGHDEDCDGVVEDADNDKSPTSEDCNDYDSAQSPKLSEEPGNFLDEDCDGIAVDADGDGMPSARHVDLYKKLGLPATDFIDCNDYDPAVHPMMSAADEAGALAGFYQGDPLVRSANFCSLFDKNGLPNRSFDYVAYDLNCDGFVSDADGDGFAALNDPSLGEENATDCDDFDPRVVPTQSGACEAPADLMNEKECKTVSPTAADCGAVTLDGQVLRTVCVAANDPDGGELDYGTCNYNGWFDGNPLVVEAGKLYGPCDGAPGDNLNELPDCPGGSTCGYNDSLPHHWSATFEAYIKAAHGVKGELRIHGSCFPICTPRK